MIGKKIWERYLIKETLKVFFFFLLSFYFLYTVIDYSIHLQEIVKSTKITPKNLGVYYVMLFSKRCDLLLPLAFLIAILKVFCSLNRKNELLAFQAGGISVKRLTRPFFVIGFFLLLLNYLNYEWLTPQSLTYIDQFEKKHFRSKKSDQLKSKVIHALPLEDGSRLIYQSYDREKKELFDVYWIRSPDHLWHMKKLSLTNHIPRGIQVDELYRSKKGLIEKGLSYKNHLFYDLKLDFDSKNYINNPMENRSISELIALLGNSKPFLKEKKNKILSHLYFKLLMPWLSIFVIIGITPFVCRFSRHQPVFLLFSLGIFGYISLFMIINASVILGESHVIAPFRALFTIPILLFLTFGYKFLKIG